MYIIVCRTVQGPTRVEHDRKDYKTTIKNMICYMYLGKLQRTKCGFHQYYVKSLWRILIGKLFRVLSLSLSLYIADNWRQPTRLQRPSMRDKMVVLIASSDNCVLECTMGRSIELR